MEESINVKSKLNIIKNCNKLFSEKTEQQEVLTEPKFFMDVSSVCGILVKKEWIKEAITQNFDVKEAKKPELSYKFIGGEKEMELYKDTEIKSKYSTAFLKVVLEMTKHYDAVVFKLKKDYPLTVSCEDFDFILAPRVE